MFGWLLVWLALTSQAPAQSQPAATSPPDDKVLREKWQQVYQKIAGSIEIRRGEAVAQLDPTPLLFYTNPERLNQQHGAIFVWTTAGRPAAIGSIWSALNRNNASVRFVTHEFHSLSDEPDVRAQRAGLALWDSGEAGIAWLRLANSPQPAASRPARLVQLRQLARQVSARITTPEQAGDLRLMTNPLYRYRESAAGVLDGAVFAYCMATDPEILLLIEVDASAKTPAYRAALARFGNLAMEVMDDGKAIWKCERGTPGRASGKYYLHWRAEEMPADPK
jgi:hypothetical protein